MDILMLVTLHQTNQEQVTLGTQMVLIGIREVQGAFVTKIAKYPQKNLLCVILLGGDKFKEWRDEADALLNAFGKEHSCEYVELFGRKGWGRALKDIDYKEITRLFAKEIR